MFEQVQGYILKIDPNVNPKYYERTIYTLTHNETSLGVKTEKPTINIFDKLYETYYLHLKFDVKSMEYKGILRM